MILKSILIPETIWLLIILGILIASLVIISMISMIKIFEKAGRNGLLSLIPFYNIIVMMKIIRLPYKELLYILIPLIGPLIFYYKYCVNLSAAFGKSNDFILGLFFLNVIFIPILAYSSDTYRINNNNYVNSNPLTTPINQVILTTPTITSSEPIQNINYDNNINRVVQENNSSFSTIPIEPSKTCKNCKYELPNIVTICPKCGMNNE